MRQEQKGVFSSERRQSGVRGGLDGKNLNACIAFHRNRLPTAQRIDGGRDGFDRRARLSFCRSPGFLFVHVHVLPTYTRAGLDL